MSANVKSNKIKAELDKSLKISLSDKEAGQVYANFALLYMRTLNDINRQYEKVLDSAIGILKEFKALK